MDVTTKNRAELKSYFVKNSIPTESNFAELIEGMLNQADDGLVKLPDNPLSIEAAGDAAGSNHAINFYRSFKDTNPDWTLNLNPRSKADDSGTANLGFNISDSSAKSRLFIQRSNGNVGLGTIKPQSPLHVEGSGPQLAEFRQAASSRADAAIKIRGSRGGYTTGDIAAIDLSNFDSSEGDGGTDYTMARISGGMQDNEGQTGYLKVYTNSGAGGLVERLRIDKNGNVGIGTTDPKAKLAVNGAIKFGGNDWQLDTGSWQNANIMYTGSSASATFGIHGAADKTIKLIIDGRVGINTTDPKSALDVQGGALRVKNGSDAAQATAGSGFLLVGDPAGNHIAIDDNEIVAKASGTTSGILHLQAEGGKTSFGGRVNAKGGLSIDGEEVAHIEADGAFYRHDGQVYITVDDNLFIRDTEGSTIAHFDTNNGRLGISRTNPRTALDTGTGVMSGAANDYIKAQFAMSGGGTVTWGGPDGRLKWTTRFIAISMGRPDSFSAGYVDINQPTSNIPAANVYDNRARSANADGVVLKGWDALYAVHTVGGNNNSVTFQIRRHTNAFNAPSNWILVAVVNDDNDTVKLGTGLVLSKNSSSTNGSSIPRGVIVMWSGTANNIPSGWALCDGSNNTRDLRNRFIVAAGPSYAVGNTGGASTVTLTTNQMPSHNHANGDYKYMLKRDGRDTSKNVDSSSNEPNLRNSGGIRSAGGGQSHENKPPYYALALIMKL